MTSQTGARQHRRALVESWLIGIVVSLLSAPAAVLAHSPWGQYQVYRQQHLLILSSRDDAPTYPYSKLLAAAINAAEPKASARPARAKDQRRVIELIRTDQMQFALSSHDKFAYLDRTIAGLTISAPVKIEVVYQFGDLLFLTRDDVPRQTIAVLTHAILESLDELPDALHPREVLANERLHSGARLAIERHVKNEHQ